MKSILLKIVIGIFAAQTAFAGDFSEDITENFRDASPLGKIGLVTMSPAIAVTMTGLSVCFAVLEAAGYNDEYDELMCVVMITPGVNTTLTGNIALDSVSYSSEVQQRKELVLAAKESAALFVGTDGASGKDAVLASAIELFSTPATANLSEVEKARLIMMTPELFD